MKGLDVLWALRASGFRLQDFGMQLFRGLPIGPKVVPFWGSYFEFYKVLPKRN